MDFLTFKKSFATDKIDGYSQLKSKISEHTNELTPNVNEILETDPKESFSSYLKENIKNVNESHKIADKLVTNVATGKSGNIHEAMLALTHAEVSFSYMVQIRNKALEAYQEVMRMQV